MPRFHGIISREEAERMLQEGDGCYLVRESQRAPGQYTLSLRFGNACKNFRLYHDGMHYVGEKRFATLQDLVADGLITMYLETYAGEYINSMCAQSRYEDSPYMTLHSYQRQLRQKQQQSLRMRHHRQPPPAAEQESHEYDKPDEELDCPLLDGIPEDINVQDFEKPHAFKDSTQGAPWNLVRSGDVGLLTALDSIYDFEFRGERQVLPLCTSHDDSAPRKFAERQQAIPPARTTLNEDSRKRGSSRHTSIKKEKMALTCTASAPRRKHDGL
ncbi:hypothetical protein HPB49_025436 [Dermacentor silvarum]|uniref:Uncharacterized protein n=1 Tax=Dermacentor silvarum TaxID=543639 RepID=A0ACB8CNE8_DERSI|nr:hypothetical protein HPB49_025436 [Dermacentor silvarum]